MYDRDYGISRLEVNMFGLFKKKKPQLMAQPDPDHTKELKAIWASLDQELKDFAKTTHDLGLRGSRYNRLKVCFNERGMSELVRQLNEIGYEISAKEKGDDRE